MITRIEIDGFKAFRNFSMEFTPLTVIAGTNASGKSNLFDALQLLSRMAETGLKTAFNEQRGEAAELFTQYGPEQYSDLMKFGAELLVARQVTDNWGSTAELKYTRLRYELHIRRGKNERGLEDLFVVHEYLSTIKHADDSWVTRMIPRAYVDFWRPKVPVGRRGKPYIYTEEKNGVITIKLPQDGRQGGKETPANVVAQTVLSGINSVDFPHAFAAKEEMRQWKFLQLSPHELRKPSAYLAKDTITQTGENLAAALHRIKKQDKMALRSISRKLNDLLPTIMEIDVVDDKANQQFVVKVRNTDGREFSSRVLSEGTLRLLALCVLLYDEAHAGLICYEEPENGVHPFRLGAMSKLLLELSVHFSEEGGPIRQVIVNTHSPVLMAEVFKLQKEQNISVWLSQIISQISDIEGQRQKIQITKMLPVEHSSLQLSLGFSEQERKLSLAEASRYLQSADFERTIGILNEP